MPALPTKQSSRPKRRTVSATARWLSASTVTSPTTASTRWPSRFAISALRSRARSRMATFAPSSMKRSTIARPSPDAPPVISATLFSSHPMSEEVAQVARQQHGLFEKDLALGDLKRALDAPQHVVARTDPRGLLGIQPRTIQVEIRFDFEPASVVLDHADVGYQMARARGRILGPRAAAAKLCDPSRQHHLV